MPTRAKTKPAPKPVKRTREAYLQVRLSAEERARFDAAAALDNRPISNFARAAMASFAAEIEKKHGKPPG